MPPMHQNYSISLDLKASNTSELFHIIGPQCLQGIRTIPFYWTSMPPRHQNYSSHPTGQGVNKSASQPSNKQGSEPASESWRPAGRLKVGVWGGCRGSDDGGDGDDVPTTLDIWRSPGPTRPGTKYPVQGIPHFDLGFSRAPSHVSAFASLREWVSIPEASQIHSIHTVSYTHLTLPTICSV